MTRSAELQQQDVHNEVSRLAGGWSDVTKCQAIAHSVQELFQELHTIYSELQEAEAVHPDQGYDSLTEIELPLPPTKKFKWKRLLRLSKPSRPPRSRKVVVWWGITMAHAEKCHLRIHLGAVDGEVYVQLTRFDRRFHRMYSSLTERNAANLSLDTLETLLKGAQYKRKNLAAGRASA